MPKINQEEYEILKSLDDKWKWIAKSWATSLYAHDTEPWKNIMTLQWEGIGNSLRVKGANFHFISWKDDEPYNIAELIEEYEHSAEHVSHVVNKRVKALGNAWNESEETEVKSKQELIDKWESAIGAAEFYGRGKDEKLIDYMKDFLSDLEQLDEPETISEEWLEKHKRDGYDEYPSGAPVLLFDDVKGLLVPKLKEITEDQAWELLKEKYEWPWADLRYTIMQQLEEGAAEAKMANLGYFEVEVDGIKYHVHEDAHSRIYDEAYEQGRSDSEREHEGDLPVIPRHVADCLNHGKNELGYNMYDFMHYATHLDEVKTKWKRAYEWIRKNADKFAKVYLNNEYRIEKESEYFIKVNGKYLTTVNIADTDSIGRAIGDVEIFYEVGDPVAATRFTKKEVEYLERYLNIEVTEVKPLPF